MPLNILAVLTALAGGCAATARPMSTGRHLQQYYTRPAENSSLQGFNRLYLTEVNNDSWVWVSQPAAAHTWLAMTAPWAMPVL